MRSKQYSKITSTSGFVDVIDHPTHGLIVSADQTYCWECDVIGGYCGNCSGAHWLEMVELEAKDVEK